MIYDTPNFFNLNIFLSIKNITLKYELQRTNNFLSRIYLKYNQIKTKKNHKNMSNLKFVYY